MVSQERHRKAMWHSRRGMLELDELLVPYATDVFPQMSHNEQETYLAFIAQEDPCLYQWMIGRETPSDVAFQTLIEQIKAHARSCRRN